MLIEVKVPQLSESVSEATLVAWHKKVGEFVQQGDNLVDIETDKVVLETPAPEAGMLTAISKSDGDAVTSKEVIATIETEAKNEEKPTLEKTVSPAVPPVVPPAARRAATENDVDISKVKGSGRGGRVTKSDVLKAATSVPFTTQEKQTEMPASVQMPAFDIASGRPEQRVAMTRLRARIAERLVESQHTAAILTTFNEVNMQPVIDLRNRHKEKFQAEHGVKLGFMSFFVKAAVLALKEFPIVNASIDGNDIIYHGYYDIGIAIGSERGLVVPILRDADKLMFAEIEKQIADYATRAKDGRLTIEELTGGTFSISNGGVFGSMLSTPIINPPQAGILGVHATQERPVVENGQIVIRPMNYFALSYDHRMIDGREAVLFLVAIKDALEDPARLLLEI